MAQAVDTFSTSDVNRRLPLLRLIVRDVVDVKKQLDDTQRRLDAMLDEDGDEPQGNDDFTTGQNQLGKLEDRLNGLLDEVEQTGGLIADLETGHVEFASNLEGDPIWLSWKYDEPVVAYWRGWHDLPHERHPLELVESP